MRIDSQFEEALTSPDRVAALRRLAQTLLDNGDEPAAILMQFEKFRQLMRRENREDEEDAIMDVMDFLTGWCSPHMKLSAPPNKR